ncbi:MAG: metal-sensing transcriptional repressor [Pseudomonadota bacterium]
MKHASHSDITNRLKRTEGHLRKVIDMLEQGRPCLDVAQQLHAVERAVRAAKAALIHDHVDHCLSGAAADPETRDQNVAEFREITRYL